MKIIPGKHLAALLPGKNINIEEDYFVIEIRWYNTSSKIVVFRGGLSVIMSNAAVAHLEDVEATPQAAFITNKRPIPSTGSIWWNTKHRLPYTVIDGHASDATNERAGTIVVIYSRPEELTLFVREREEFLQKFMHESEWKTK